MANLSWIKGMKSPNPEGGRRRRNETVDSIIERLLAGVFKYQAVKKRIVKLTDWQFTETYLKLLAIKIPKPQANAITEEEAEIIREMVENKIINDAKEKKTG
jgi:hypothetical protein